MVKTVDEMICTIHCQVAAIRKCQECYIARQELPAHWFQEPCSRPHLLVWAKVRGFRFWPGKVMEVLPNGRVDVHFFGTHNTATIRASECLVYSPQDPTGRPCRTKKWRKAIVEVNQHLAKLAAQFGDVNISSSKQLSTATIKEHLETMLPGASQRKLSETQK
ncbi:kinase C-binding protein 1 [Anopheles sinensis]|uniref:Kinase C-binding protein 1 n=1 Tax=Anopheles sinensis TaxID=74873 RepID=A0A084WFS9_ANOSI|nr:kinase C-binding protein 1 [Anopheles sinensis]